MLPPRVSSRLQENLDPVAAYWNDGCPFKSRLVDVVSASIPCAERLIIEVVRRMALDSNDDALKAQGHMLIQHEAAHLKMHSKLNDRLRAQGLPIDQLEECVRTEVARVLRHQDPQWQMGYATALEYLGVAVSHCLVHDRLDVIRDAHPTMRTLYLDHARDEIEHAHVVPSFARASRVGYLRRVLPMIHVTGMSLLVTARFTDRMLARDGIGMPRRLLLSTFGWWWLVLGTIVPLIPLYLRFYSPTMSTEPLK
jgi:uncharacterized protein